jgi:glycine/serine hydroxymethyltransferase
MKEKDMEKIAEIIDNTVKYRKDEDRLSDCAKDVAKLIKKFPLYPELG